MKQMIAGMFFVAMATLVASPAIVKAQSAETISASENSSLLLLLQSLMKKVEELQKQLSALRGEVQQVRAELKDGLREGVSDDDVKKVQELLASDPTIYPKGLVSGYYGPLTKEAVMAFQKRHDLPQTGIVDVATKEIMLKYLKENNGKIAPGLMKAPGIEKKIIEGRYEKKDDDDDDKDDDEYEKKDKTKYQAEIKSASEGMIGAAKNVIADLKEDIADAKDDDVSQGDIDEAEEYLVKAEAQLESAEDYYAEGKYEVAYDEAYKAKKSAYKGMEELK
jgi:peptidoglycan hydrolase-like protein with peptidoglycan-binding domain